MKCLLKKKRKKGKEQSVNKVHIEVKIFSLNMHHLCGQLCLTIYWILLKLFEEDGMEDYLPRLCL